MRTSVILSLALFTAVFGNPMFSPSGGGGGQGGGQGGGGQNPGGWQSHGVDPGGFGAQRASTAGGYQNYANRNPQEQPTLEAGQKTTQQLMEEHPEYYQANLRKGPHTDGSQPQRVSTIQMPADGSHPPPTDRSGNPVAQGPSGYGTVAVHQPTHPDGSLDHSRQPVVLPGQGNPGNKDQGKTTSYDPQNPMNLPHQPPYRKRSLERRSDFGVRKELLKRPLAIRDLLEQELVSNGFHLDLN